MEIAVKKHELTIVERINKDIRNLNRIFKNLDDEVRKIADGIIKRVAFMKVTLEDLERDLNENGYTEKFTQSADVEAYDRKRPAVEIYNTTIKNYLSACRQLQDLLPKPSENGKREDEFDAYLKLGNS